MKHLIVAAMVAGMLASSAVWAETAQQNLMKSCNEEAGKKSLSGDARKAFMSSCLSGDTATKPAAGGSTAQQQRMKDCNAEAASKELKGDARKTFMSTCLSGDTAAKAAVETKPASAAKPATAEKPAAGGVTPQQQRMKDCNAEAASKELKGDARKTFMSTCLSNKK
jgi:hypothetical protein